MEGVKTGATTGVRRLGAASGVHGGTELTLLALQIAEDFDVDIRMVAVTAKKHSTGRLKRAVERVHIDGRGLRGINDTRDTVENATEAVDVFFDGLGLALLDRTNVVKSILQDRVGEGQADEEVGGTRTRDEAVSWLAPRTIVALLSVPR